MAPQNERREVFPAPFPAFPAGHRPGSYAMFRAFLRRRLPDDETADDILQQSLLKVMARGLEGRDSVDEERSVAWFYRILRNAVADHYRNRAIAERRAERYHAESATGSPPDERHGEPCACFRTLWPELRPEHAEALGLVDLDGLTPREAAARLGVSPNNLNVRLHRARGALRKRLETACGDCATHGCFSCTCHDADHESRCGPKGAVPAS